MQTGPSGIIRIETRYANCQQVRMPFPGRRAGIAARISVALVFIFLSTFGFAVGLPNLFSGSPNSDSGRNDDSASSQLSRMVGSDAVPDLSLPKTVFSTIGSATGHSGVIESSPDNFTLYSPTAMLRILNGIAPHDELLGSGFHLLSSWATWRVEARNSNGWEPLGPLKGSLKVVGDNSTGVFITRRTQVEQGPENGTLSISYNALPSGPLTWDLSYAAGAVGQYRLLFEWRDAPDRATVDARSRHYSAMFPDTNYTFSWDDVSPVYNVTWNVAPRTFSLAIDLGLISRGSIVHIDPSLIGWSQGYASTSHTFQRKTFQESKGGYYWTFFERFDLSTHENLTQYESSKDGSSWGTSGTVPLTPCCAALPTDYAAMDIYNSGQKVVVATGTTWGYFGGFPTISSGEAQWVSVQYVIGTISGGSISWSPVYAADSIADTCYDPSGGCSIKMGIRYVSVTAASDGTLAFSYNFFESKHDARCPTSSLSESSVYVSYKGARFLVDRNQACGSLDLDPTNLDRSIVMAANSNGRVLVLYQFPSGSSAQLRARSIDGATTTSAATLVGDTYINNWNNSAGGFTNYSGLTSLDLVAPQSTSPGQESDILLNFNYPPLPANAAISQATLKFYVTGSGVGLDDIAVFMSYNRWNTTTVTWNTFNCCSPILYNPSTSLNPAVNLALYPPANFLSLTATNPIRGYYDNKWNNNTLFVSMNVANSQTGIFLASSRSSYPKVSLTVSSVCCIGPIEIVDSGVESSDQFSASTDANYGVHIVYRLPDGTVSYAYRSSTGWTGPTRDILAGPANNPTITTDLSTNDAYAFALKSSSIIMRSKHLTMQWSDHSVSYPITGRTWVLSDLGSNFASIANSNSSRIELIWTETGPPSCPPGCYNYMYYASIPIQSTWSPFASPSDPWDGNGVAPFGQYFTNLGEYVSPSSGMLTLRQTDLKVPGRGLDLEITRVYTEPQSFQGGEPNDYEGWYGFRDETFTTGWHPVQGLGSFSVVSEGSDGDVLNITGSPQSPGDDYHYWERDNLVVNTTLFPYFVARWRTSASGPGGLGAGIVIIFSDGTGQVVQQSNSTSFSVGWVTRAYSVTPGKIATSILLFADDYPDSVQTGTYSVFYDYVGFTKGSSLGNGWQLNFPWINRFEESSYLHLWDGEAYLIPSTFWNGQTSTFENHQGENFRLVRSVDGSLTLYNKQGTAYLFDPTHKLTSIIDSTGANSIQFSYDSSGRLSSITDTVGRVFQFVYNPNLPMLLQSIVQTGASGTGSFRSITYTYNGKLDLVSVSDPAGRITTYDYSSSFDPGVNPWLMTRITYPTGWYTNYGYTKQQLGSEPFFTSYQVSTQCVSTGLQCGGTYAGSTVRQFQYSYSLDPGGRVSAATVTAYNGTQLAGYFDYSFSYAGMVMNVSDASHKLVRGVQQIFGMGGEVIKETFLVTNGTTVRSYTNYYGYDLWGNQIYSRKSIGLNSTPSQEVFNSYYGNGETLGFYAFQDSFGRNQGNAPDNSWTVSSGYWMVSNGVYNGTETSGRQEDVFSSADIGTPDLTLQARVYISHVINASDQRVGIFVHHSTGDYKWMLVLHNANAGQYYLQLNDEFYGGWPPLTDPGSYSCPIAYNVWWTFNMTVRGINVNGWATYPGQATPCTVSRTFSIFSPAILGTGFGLYAGGFSALFDDAQVATVSPFITGNGFSNSFVQNGAPGPIGLNTWLATTKPPAPGWNSTINWLPASGWSPAYASQDLGGSPWGLISGWQNFGYAQWIWWDANAYSSGSSDPVWFRRVFASPAGLNVHIAIVSDNTYVLYLDGVKVGSQLVPANWNQVGSYNQTLGPGSYHVLAVSATNPDGPDPAGLLVSVTNAGTQAPLLRTDATTGPVISALAGTAELQNGTASSSVETYYGYTMAGQLSLTRRFYNSTTGTQWISTTRTYDSYGNLLTLADPHGNATSYGYSARYASAYLTSRNQTLIPGGTLISATYGYNFTLGALAWSKDPNASNTTYSYDILGRMTKLRYSTGDYMLYSYSDAGNYVNMTNENGLKTRWLYDGLSRLTTVERFSGSSSYSREGYSYNWQDKIVKDTDPLGNISTQQYDALGRTTLVVKPDGNSTQTLYNDIQGWVQVVGEDLNSTCNFHDRLGRLISVVEYAASDCTARSLNGIGYVTTFTYDEVGNFVKKTAANLQVTQYSFDNLNRLTRTTYPDKSSESYVYDNNGNLVRKTDRNAFLTSYAYDSLNRVTAITYNSSPVMSESYSYDNNGNVLQLQNQNATIGYSYDARNRVAVECYYVNMASIGCPPASGGSVAYGTLITLANRTSIPVQNLEAGMQLLAYNVTTGQYAVNQITSINTVTTTDMLVIQTEDPLPLRVDNATAQKLWVMKSDGTKGWYSVTQLRIGDYLFNALDQRWTKVLRIGVAPSGLHIMYDIYTTAPNDYIANGYLDPKKQSPVLTSSSTPSGTVGQSYNVTYTYSGEYVNTITYPNSMQVVFSYDGLGRVQTINRPGAAGNDATFSYDKDDNVNTISYGNGVLASYTYDKLSRIQSITVTQGSNLYFDLYYQYGKTGTVTSVGGQNIGGCNNNVLCMQVVEQYQYDPLHRLTNATVTSGGATTKLWYQYDQQGNRIWQGLNSSSTNNNWVITKYAYRLDNNELLNSTTVKGPAASTVYTYDSNGNQASRTINGASQWTYSWDVPSDLLKVANGTNVQGFYAYDGMDRRVETREGTATTFYAYSGTETLVERVYGGSETNYVYAGGMRVESLTGSSKPIFFHNDALGSTRLVTDSSSNPKLLFSDNYQPYGQDNSASGSQTYKFTGKPFSTATGLYYDYQRWYDPSIGRFISQDPLTGDAHNPQSLNPYGYVLNAPTRLVDPTGADYENGVNRQQIGSIFLPTDPPIVTADFWQNIERLSPEAVAPQSLGVEPQTTLDQFTSPPTEFGQTGSSITELDEFAQNVPRGDLRPFTNSQGQIINRAFGGDAQMSGRFYTTYEPTSSPDAIQKLNLPQGPRVVNTARYLVKGYLPPGNDLLVGRTFAGYTQIEIANPLYRITVIGIYVLPE